MRVLIVLASLLFLGVSVRADDLDDIKAREKVKRDEFEAKVKDILADAEKTAKTNPKKATEVLGALESDVEFSPLSEERKRELAQQISSRIQRYKQLNIRTPDYGKFEERARRYEATEQKNAELKVSHQQMAELMRQGKYREAGAIANRLKDKFGESPALYNADRLNKGGAALRELQSIRDEKSDRFVSAQREFMRSMIPVTEDVTFPADWKERSKRRTQFKITPAEEKLLKALNRTVTMDFKGQPLQTVIEELEKRYDIKIDIQKLGLDQAGLTEESPVSIKVREVSLRSALKKMLGDVGLTYSIRDAKLKVTTPQLAAQDHVIRAYYIGDLLQVTNMTFDPFFNQAQFIQNIASMIAMIQSIDPTSWEANGGTGTIVFDPIRQALIIKQSAEMQFQLQGQLGR